MIQLIDNRDAIDGKESEYCGPQILGVIDHRQPGERVTGISTLHPVPQMPEIRSDYVDLTEVDDLIPAKGILASVALSSALWALAALGWRMISRT